MLQRGTLYLWWKKNVFAIFFWVLFALSIFVRVWQFPHIPGGFNQDEAAAAYESYSLLETGQDKWGNPYPAYFPGLGDGQSVLMSYLSVPFIKVFGLSIFSARLAELVCGILMIPLIYLILREFDRRVALVGVAFVGLTPWHWMLSRWALDANILPFFTALAVFALVKALKTQKKSWILATLPLFALAFYAYGIAILVLPPFLLIIAILFYPYWKQQYKTWLVSALIALIIGFPFLLYAVKNYVFHANFWWEKYLSFTSPLLIANRLEQKPGYLMQNVQFSQRGFDDGTIYNTIPGFNVLFWIVQPFALFGLLWIGQKILIWWQNRRTQNLPLETIFVVWFLVSLTPLLIFDVNINRANSLYVPLILIGAYGVIGAYDRLSKYPIAQKMAAAVLSIYFIVQVVLFFQVYFYTYNDIIARPNRIGLDQAIAATPAPTRELPVLITGFPINYSFVGVYARFDPHQFHTDSDVTNDGSYYQVSRMGQYFLKPELVQNYAQYYYVAHRGNHEACVGTRTKITYYYDIEQGLCNTLTAVNN